MPIYCKMTIDGVKRQQFFTRLYSRPELWDEDAKHGVLQYVCGYGRYSRKDTGDEYAGADSEDYRTGGKLQCQTPFGADAGIV